MCLSVWLCRGVKQCEKIARKKCSKKCRIALSFLARSGSMFTVTNTNTPTVMTEAQSQDGDRDSVTSTVGGMWMMTHDDKTGEAEFGVFRPTAIRSIWESVNAMGKTLFTEIEFEDKYGHVCQVTLFGMAKMDFVVALLGAPDKYNH